MRNNILPGVMRFQAGMHEAGLLFGKQVNSIGADIRLLYHVWVAHLIVWRYVRRGRRECVYSPENEKNTKG
jgi:hypothetical protein